MATIKQVLGVTALICSPLAIAQELNQAEVRLSYAEFKQLLSQAQATPKAETPKPELLSARLQLSMEQGQPLLVGSFRTVSFGNEIASAPLISGDVSIVSQQPESALVVVKDGTLSVTTRQAGSQTLELNMLPRVVDNSCTFTIPPCPAAILNIGSLPEDKPVVLKMKGHDHVLSRGQSIPITHSSGPISLHFQYTKPTLKELPPPQPSTWTWQHQALVEPVEDKLQYTIVATASAPDGSGVGARVPMPPDAQSIQVTGEDLISHEKIRGENRALTLKLNWKTRGILDRKVLIQYRMPLRPLDPSWTLQVPGDEKTRTRFILPQHPQLDYAAEDLSPASRPQGLPSDLTQALQGRNCHFIEAASSVTISVKTIPVAAIAKGTVKTAEWNAAIEPDGAMMVSGKLTIEHQESMDFEFDTPEGMKLLTCELNGTAVPPVDLGKGRLMVSLPNDRKESRLNCSFTAKLNALDPVDGTMSLSLPHTPTFIHSLSWSIGLPAGYQAETHGNLKRISSRRPDLIGLQKNLCRDERPQVRVFYQRTDLNL